MRSALIINNLAIALSAVLILLSYGNYNLGVFAALSILFTGFVQLIIAINYMNTYYKDKDKLINYYFLGVALFFALWISPLYTDFIWIIPAVLAIYLTYILYRKYNTLNYEP